MMYLMTALLFLTPTDSNALDGLNADLQQVYDVILMDNGYVDYSKLKSDPKLMDALNRYAAFLNEFDPESVDQTSRVAILSNAYNVFTLIGVTKAWPTKSVTKIRPMFGFFKRNDYALNGKKISLNTLENKMLRPLEKRTHFVINCASASCPVIQPQVLTGKNLEQIMDDATLAFLNDDSKNRFDQSQGEWHISKIFKWFQEDWGKEADVVAFIQKYRPDLKEKPKKVKYMEYDWALNGPTK